MNRNTLIALALTAGTLAAAPAGLARDVYPDYHRPYADAGRRHDRFIVRFHLDAGRGRVQAKSEDRARRIADLLASVGADAHVARGCIVYYRMRGEGRVIRHSHEDAHRLAQKLSGYGFHTDVRHG